ncbi:MAG: hypothetical protein U0936_23325 [Planctomycetaceae bacterium]
MTAEDIRTVEFIVTRPKVDLNCPGCVGGFLGGHRSLFLGGLDDRIEAVYVMGDLAAPSVRTRLDISIV